MILKGNQRAGGTDLATHLMNAFDNERVEVAQIRGTVADHLHGAFAEYEALAAGTRCKEPLYSLSVNPSAILMIEGSGPRETLDVLGKASVPLVTVPEGYDRDAIVKKILTVGKALDAEAKARALADEVAADIDAAVADASKVPEDKRKRVLFVLTVQNGKIMAAGSHTAADGILRLAGAVNATGGFHGYKPINDEAVIEARPDVILMMTHGGPIVGDEEILSNPAVALTPAGKDRRIIRMSSLTMLGFGPRTADAIRDLSKSLYGG